MPDLLSSVVSNMELIIGRLTWMDLVDLALVTLVFFAILLLLRDTQAMVLLRGILLLIVLMSLLTTLDVLPAFSWLVERTLPALLLAIPVIFAPEIRRTLERLGRAGSIVPAGIPVSDVQEAITAIVSASARLSDRHHGALIIMQRSDTLDEYIKTGVTLNAHLTPELLLQIFYPNTPLHDGAAIIWGRAGDRCLLCPATIGERRAGALARSPDGLAPPRRAGHFGSDRCRGGCRLGRDRLYLGGARRADDPPPGYRAVGEYSPRFLPPL